MKKLLVYIGVMALCSFVTVVIDHLIGVKFTDVGVVGESVHKAIYMLWGAALVGMNKWLEN